MANTIEIVHEVLCIGFDATESGVRMLSMSNMDLGFTLANSLSYENLVYPGCFSVAVDAKRED